MATTRLPLLFRSLPSRAPTRFTKPLVPAVRTLATTKHPKGFVPPSEDDLLELRERVQEFTSKLAHSMYTFTITSNHPDWTPSPN